MKLLIFLVSLTLVGAYDDLFDTEREDPAKEVKVIVHSADGYRDVIRGDECENGVHYEEATSFSCACVTGVFAFYGKWCSRPMTIFAGDNYCFRLPIGQTSQISLISSPYSISEPTLTRLTPGHTKRLETYDDDTRVNFNTERSWLIVSGESDWELEAEDGERYCLSPPSNHNNGFCSYNTMTQINVTIKHVRLGCYTRQNLLSPNHCQIYARGEYGDESMCTDPEKSAFKPRLLSRMDVFAAADIAEGSAGNRIRRQAPAPIVNNGPIEDEDWIDPAMTSVVNNPIIMDQLRDYLDAQISSTTGSVTPFQSNTRGIPALLMLEQALAVMKRTCTVISEAFFTLAYNAFINIQTTTYHVKEPYISQPAYLRIKAALSQCIISSEQHNFVNGTQANMTSNDTCEGKVEPMATNQTMKDNVVYNLTISDDKRGHGYEPLIETVWKIMLNAHSYCYKYFSDYYNDHHTFTVTLLPLFTNEIQNIWMNVTFPNGTYVEPAAGLQLYGGIIGDHGPLIDNMDLCVAASRIGSAYPWLMNRPPKDESNRWSSKRRKRSVGTDPGRESRRVCLNKSLEAFLLADMGRCE